MCSSSAADGDEDHDGAPVLVSSVTALRTAASSGRRPVLSSTMRTATATAGILHAAAGGEPGGLGVRGGGRAAAGDRLVGLGQPSARSRSSTCRAASMRALPRHARRPAGPRTGRPRPAAASRIARPARARSGPCRSAPASPSSPWARGTGGTRSAGSGTRRPPQMISLPSGAIGLGPSSGRLLLLAPVNSCPATLCPCVQDHLDVRSVDRHGDGVHDRLLTGRGG